jgi:hypothetical protein
MSDNFQEALVAATPGEHGRGGAWNLLAPARRQRLNVRALTTSRV